jgi:hypothetical protein
MRRTAVEAKVSRTTCQEEATGEKHGKSERHKIEAERSREIRIGAPF